MAEQAPIDRFRSPEFVGMGSFGVVAKVSVWNNATNQLESRAMKMVANNDPKAMNEVEKLLSNQHDNLVRCFGSLLINPSTLSPEWKQILQHMYKEEFPKLMIASELEYCEGDYYI